MVANALKEQVAANYNKKRFIIALIVAIIILLLLMRKKGNTVVNNTNQTLGQPNVGGVTVAPIYNGYSAGPLDLTIPGDPDLWDWMQSTDCACNCDEAAYSSQSVAATAYPVYSYIAAPAFPVSQVNYNFPVYTPPPSPKWWYDDSATGFTRYTAREDNDRWVPLTVIHTSDGHFFQYDDTYRYLTPSGVVSQGNFTVSGDNLYWGGKKYVHDYTKDKYAQVYLLSGATGVGVSNR